MSPRYGERLAEVGIEPSVDSRGESCDNSLTIAVGRLCKAEPIHRRTNRKSKGSVELARIEWASFSKLTNLTAFTLVRLGGGRSQLPATEFEATTIVTLTILTTDVGQSGPRSRRLCVQTRSDRRSHHGIGAVRPRRLCKGSPTTG